QFPQRRAARGRALHARRRRSHQLRGDHRGREGVHAPVEDEHDPEPAQGKEFQAARIRVLLQLTRLEEPAMRSALLRSMVLAAGALTAMLMWSASVSGQ